MEANFVGKAVFLHFLKSGGRKYSKGKNRGEMENKRISSSSAGKNTMLRMSVVTICSLKEAPRCDCHRMPVGMSPLPLGTF